MGGKSVKNDVAFHVDRFSRQKQFGMTFAAAQSVL
jgi:hypothetical protein